MQITAAAASAAATNLAGQTGTAPAKKDEVTKDAFLKLLVAQIQNQDPLNPTDGVQFLSQLAQFSQLEQTLGIRGDLATIIENTGAAAMGGNNE